ncbi:MAG: nucleotidyltransferase domain-containing protein [Ardenticatenales bacterium]|nr:nucleotidyltransferase domain-containing protein [Ardenticatenales bacterium]
MREANRHLLTLAEQLTASYKSIPSLRALLLTGSVAEGEADFYSDIDLILYYEALPTEEALERLRVQNGGSARLWMLGERAEGSVMESYQVRGVECQLTHSTVARWEENMASILEQFTVDTPLHKALAGLLAGRALYGDDLIHRWQAQVKNYPPALAQAMVRHYLNFVPLWALTGRLGPRDSELLQRQMVVENVQHLLGVLAGLNHLYYSTFQFKRMHRFIAQMHLTPRNLAARLDDVLGSEPLHAAPVLKSLIQDTVALMEQQIPEIDTSQVRAQLEREAAPWGPRR